MEAIRSIVKLGAILCDQLQTLAAHSSTDGNQDEDSSEPPPGHGRYGADDYPGANQVEVKHPKHAAGVTTNNFAQARRIIATRSKESKKNSANKQYTVTQLRHDIAETTRVKTSYVREAKNKENRFMTLLNGINSLWNDPELMKLLNDEKLADRPALVGDFGYEP